MPRVALFIFSFAGGGAEKALANMTWGLVGRGIEVDVVLLRKEGPFLSALPPQVQVLDLQAPDVPFRFAKLCRYLHQHHSISPTMDIAIKAHFVALKLAGYWRSKRLNFLLLSRLLALKLGDYLRQRKPNAMLSALTGCNLIALLSRQFAYHNGCRVIVSEQNTPSVSWRHNPNGGLWCRLARRLYPEADSIVCVSQGIAEDLRQLINLPPEKIQVIYNPVVAPELFQKTKEPVNHPWFENGQTPVILAVGRLTKQKDFPTLLRAFALVRQQRPARLVILGEGEERENLEQLAETLKISNDVSMPGFTLNPFAFMAKASVFVLSSAWEGLAIVVIEALACGCPVVATDCRSGPREILDNGRYGRLVPVGDYEALAKAILETLDNPDFPADKETRIQRAMEFSVDVAVDKYLKVLLG